MFRDKQNVAPIKLTIASDEALVYPRHELQLIGSYITST